GRAFAPHDLGAEQAPAPALGEHLDGDLLRARVVAGARRALDRGVYIVEAGARGFGFGEAGSPDLVRAHLGDRGADHAAEHLVATGDVDADDATLFVRVRTERDVGRRAGEAVKRLDAVARGPHAVDARRHVRVGRDAAG